MKGLQFGYNAGLPEGCTAAWGARWIIKQEGYVDQVYDRQSAFGPDEERKAIVDHLNDVVKGKHMDAARRLLKKYELRTDENKEVTLYRDSKMVIRANPNASYGYLYVAAFWAKDLPLVSEFSHRNKGSAKYGLTDEAVFTGERRKALAREPVDFPVVKIGEVEGLWSGGSYLPKIGEKVSINLEDWGSGRVVAYFIEANFIGVEVRSEEMPKWAEAQIREEGGNRYNIWNNLFFGIDLGPWEVALR